MNINYEYDDVKASERLEVFTGKKLSKLFDKFDNIIRADVFFQTENTSSPETGMICKIRLSIPGPRLFSESSNGNFEASIAHTVDDLERQLQKRKDKLSRIK